LNRYKYPKNTFFEFFSWGLCTGTKGEKVEIFGFSIGTKTEKLKFYSSNILNSSFEISTFSPLVPLQSPQEIEENNSKKVFCFLFVPVQIPYFWT
jgi:hypothetical protein